jgi:CBS domain-containing protein
VARDFETAEPSEMLEGAFQRLQVAACPAMPVLEAEELVGILTLGSIETFLTMRSALPSGPVSNGQVRQGCAPSEASPPRIALS